MAEEKRSGPLYKIVLAGDVGVGKTSIFQRYDKDKFYDHKNPTFGMDSLTRDVMIDGKRICQINVWDTAGLEKTRSLTSNYYRNAHAVIFVYAIDDMYTLNALKGWVTDVDTDAKTALKFLVGNKTDLVDEGFQVDKQQAESFRKNNGLHSVYEVSAKTGTGVKEMFENIGKLLVQSKTGAVQKKDAFAVIDTENENGSEKTSSGCCG